jgi:hypothetical protein
MDRWTNGRGQIEEPLPLILSSKRESVAYSPNGLNKSCGVTKFFANATNVDINVPVDNDRVFAN